MTRAVIALGSNLGDREVTLRAAVRELGEHPEVVVLAASPLVQTAAVKLDGVDEAAPRYLNAVAIVETGLTARELLTVLNGIEAQHGRTREVRWGDRTLDLDIVAFGAETVDDADLTLPHPRAAERDFVLVPWMLADPAAELPGVGTIAALPASSATLEIVDTAPLWEARA